MSDELDYEGMGIELAKQLRWDGIGILKVAISALHDANFHAEADEVQRSLDELEAMEDILNFNDPKEGN
jgi:hypothetical protein